MLERYTCTKCGAHPNGEKEVFFGCGSCGNRFFKIQDVDPSPKTKSLNQSSIEVDGTGMYRVNVDKLFKDTNKNKKSPFMVSGEEGVYHIKL